jgi:hypothetical protein
VIPLRQRTAEVLLAINQEVEERQRAFRASELRLHDMLRTIYTEHGIQAAQPVRVTEHIPYELVLVNVIYAPEA